MTADIFTVLVRTRNGDLDVTFFISSMSPFETSPQERESSYNVFIGAATGESSGRFKDATSILTASVSSEAVPMFFSYLLRASIASTCADMSFQSDINCVPKSADIFGIRDVTI